MAFERKFVFFLSLIMLAIKIAATTYFIGTLRPYSSDYFPNDFEIYMSKVNVIILIGLLGTIAGICLQNLFGKIVSLFSISLIFGAYIWWYYEKFEWFEAISLKEGTIEYSKRLNQVGWFREAAAWDYIILFFAVTLFVWIIFRYQYKQSNSLQ